MQNILLVDLFKFGSLPLRSIVAEQTPPMHNIFYYGTDIEWIERGEKENHMKEARIGL